MAHLAALTITEADVIADSKNAPDGTFEETSTLMNDSQTNNSDNSFEAGKDTLILKTANSDLSTDSGSDHFQEDFLPIIQQGSRLSIFQRICQQDKIGSDGCGSIDESDGSEKVIEQMSDDNPEEVSSTEATSALLKLMNMEEESQVVDFEENWSQSSGENLTILE